MGKNRKGNAPQVKRKPLPKKKRKRDEVDIDDIQIITGNNMQEPVTQRKKKIKSVNSDDVVATIQLRQKVQHKKSLYYLEQLILKHKIQDKYAFDVKEVPYGLNFLFYRENEASKIIEFLKSLLPVNVTKRGKGESENFNVEIASVCKYDVICLPQRLFNSMGNLGPILICFKVNENLYFIDPVTLQAGEINAIQFFYKEKASFKSLLSIPRKYTVLDVKLENKKNGIFQLATVQICKEDEIGEQNSIITVSTHLGNALQTGDTVIGYDLANSNLNDENLESFSQLQIPDVVIVRKCYERPWKRYWNLKQWKIERKDDFDEFLDELEEDKEMRGKINLYRDDSIKMDTEEHLEKLKNIPHVGLEELLIEKTKINSFEPLKDLKNYSVNLTKDFVLIFGGENKEGLTNQTLIWNEETKEFKELKIEGELKPSCRSFHNSLILNNQLFVFGGRDGEKVLNDMYCLDLSENKKKTLKFLETNEWKEIKYSDDSEIPLGRQGSILTFEKERIVLHGGCNFEMDTFYSDFNEFCLKTSKWSKMKSSLTNECSFHTIVRCLERVEIIGGMKNKTEIYTHLIHFPELDKLDRFMESKEQYLLNKIINFKNIGDTFINFDKISSVSAMSEYKYKLIRKQLENEFHTFYDKPTEETLFKTIYLKYLHMVMINFPLFQTQIEKKEKGFMEKLGWGSSKKEEDVNYGFGDLFFKMPDLITKLEISFKKDYQKDMIDYGAGLFNYVLKTNKELSIADEFTKKFSREGTKESLGNQNFEEEDVNLINDILHLDAPIDVYKKIMEAKTMKELPGNYQKMIQHASQRLMKWLKMTDVSDDNMEKLRWTKNFLILMRPLASSVNPMSMIEKMMNLMLFSKIGRTGIVIMLEVSKTENEVKKRKQEIPSIQVENVEKYLFAREIESSMKLSKTFLFTEEEMEQRKKDGLHPEKELAKAKKPSMFRKLTSTKKELPSVPSSTTKKELPTTPTTKKDLPTTPTTKKELPTSPSPTTKETEKDIPVPNIIHTSPTINETMTSPRKDSTSTTPRGTETKQKALSFEEQERLLADRLDIETWKHFVFHSINNQNVVLNKSLTDKDIKNTFLLFRAICRLHEKKEFIAILDDPELQKLLKQVMKVTLPHLFQLYAHCDVSRVTSTITTAMGTFISLSEGDKKANEKISQLTDETKKQQLEKKRQEAWEKTFGGMMDTMKEEVFQIMHEMIIKDKEKDNIIGKLINWVDQMAKDVGNKSIDMEEIFFKFEGEERELEFLKEINYLLYNTRNLPQMETKQKPVKAFNSSDFIKKEKVQEEILHVKPTVRSYSSDPTTHHHVGIDEKEEDIEILSTQRKKSDGDQLF